MGFDIDKLPGGRIDMPSCPGSDYSLDLPDHVLAYQSGSGKRLLLVGHLDNVFPPDRPLQSYRRGGDRVSGPVATDMQGGQVVMLNALKAPDAKGLLEDMTVTVQLNGDEEMGSLSSSKYLKEQVALHDYRLAYEFTGTNNLVRVRKGLGLARYVVNGTASHAGGAHERGCSAIKELAYKIVEIENLTDSGGGNDGSLTDTDARGLTKLDSLGIAGTGTHSNHNQIRLGSLLERAQLSTVLIGRLGRK